MEKILDRIGMIAKQEGISIGALERIIGASKGVLSRAMTNGTDIQSKWIQSLVENYPSYSAEWLLVGIGPMMKSATKQKSEIIPLTKGYVKHDNVNNSVESNDCRYKEDAIESSSVSEPTLVNPRKNIKKSDNSTDGIPLITIDAVAGFPTIDEPGRAIADCDRYVVPEFTDKGAQFLIRVSGSSMYPKYSSGDILACKKITERLFFQWGKIYVIDSSQGILVKRVFPDNDHPDMIKLVSDNKDYYPPFDIPKSDIRSLSIVIGAIRFE